MRNRITSVLAAILVSLSGIFVVAAPAQALPDSKCNINAAPWINATDGSPANWGRVRFCVAFDDTPDDEGWYPLFQVDDTLTDGYQVHLEFQDSFSGWTVFHEVGNNAECANVQSAGAIVESCWSANTWSYYGGNDLRMRLVKGRACCPHQDVAHWEYASEWYWVLST